ncbi:5'-deoxynucleotidase YfbR [compost metagenome]
MERMKQMSTLEQQINFLKEIDRLKSVVRQSPLLDQSRKENSAEHSWHLAMYALILNDYASGTVNTNRVIQMLLLHDIVEIDVGDFPIHGGSSHEVQAEQEASAARRIFGLLPAEQGNNLLDLWQEFELAETEDAQFAKAIDRFQPLLINIFTGGGTWTESGVSLDQVFSRYGPVIKRGAPLLWTVCEKWVSQHFSGQAPRASDSA